MLKIEKKLIEVIENNLDKIVLAFLLIASVYLRYKYTPLVNITDGGSDYKSEILPWIMYYKEHGVLNTLASGVGDYYVPYNLLIAFISLLDIEPFYILCLYSYFFEYLMVIFLYKIVMLLLEGTDNKLLLGTKFVKCAVAFLLVVPMVVANGAIWKQSDSSYAAIFVVSLYYFLKKKYRVSFIWLGVAFSLKLQTVFVIPFFLIAYFVLKEFSILEFLWIPVVYLIAGIPAIICGQRITHVYGTYYRQMGEYGAMTINTPGLYIIGLSEYMYHHVAMVLTVSALAAMMFYLSVNKKIKLDGVLLLYLAGWSAMTCFELLPNMHERYDYIAIIVLTTVAMFFRKKIIPAVLIMHLTSACTYGKFLFNFKVNDMLLAIAYLIAYCWITYDFISFSGGRNCEKTLLCN